MTASGLAGASVFEERPYQHFNQRVAQEKDLIDAYGALAERTEVPPRCGPCWWN